MTGGVELARARGDNRLTSRATRCDARTGAGERVRLNVLYDHVVLGSGVAGLTAAYRLSECSQARVIVLESFAQPGGNQQSYAVGPYTFDVGAFYYWRGMPFFQMFPGVEATCQPAVIKRQRVNRRGEIHAYPYSFQDEFLARGPVSWARGRASLARARLARRAPESAEDFARYYMGGFLYYDLGLQAFLQRFYGIAPEEIELEFAIARMEPLRQLASLRSGVTSARRWLQRRTGAGKSIGGEAQLLVRPEAGFAAMYAPSVEALRDRNVDFRFDSPLQRVSRQGDGWLLSGEGFSIPARQLVATVPITVLCSALGLPATEGLRSSHLETLFFSFQGDRGFDGCILYNFGDFGSWKRLTMHSDHYGARDGRQYFSVECPREDGDTSRSPQSLADAFRSDTARTGLFAGDLRLEGSCMLSHAYPVYSHGTSARVDRVLTQLTGMGIVSLGRQGRFEYLPSGSKVVEQVDHVLSNR